MVVRGASASWPMPTCSDDEPRWGGDARRAEAGCGARRESQPLAGQRLWQRGAHRCPHHLPYVVASPENALGQHTGAHRPGVAFHIWPLCAAAARCAQPAGHVAAEEHVVGASPVTAQEPAKKLAKLSARRNQGLSPGWHRWLLYMRWRWQLQQRRRRRGRSRRRRRGLQRRRRRGLRRLTDMWFRGLTMLQPSPSPAAKPRALARAGASLAAFECHVRNSAAGIARANRGDRVGGTCALSWLHMLVLCWSRRGKADRSWTRELQQAVVGQRPEKARPFEQMTHEGGARTLAEQ